MAQIFLGKAARKRVKRSAALRKLTWASEAAALAIVWWFSARLASDRASAAGRRLLKALGPRLPKTQIMLRNLALAFPEKSAAQLGDIVRDVWGNAGAVMAEYPHLNRICGSESDQRIEVVTKVDLAALRETKQAVFVSAHLANWEVSAAAMVLRGIPLDVVYTPLQNPWLDRMVLRRRQSLGCGLIGRDGGVRQIMRQLGGGSSVGLIVDQRVDSGEPLPLFGLNKLTTVVPARLALRFRCDLIPVRVERLSGARFRVTVHEPIQPDPSATTDAEKITQMMGKINILFESWIREQPGEWLCTKRRWPKDTLPRRQAQWAG